MRQDQMSRSLEVRSMRWSGGDLRIPRYLDKLPLMDPGPSIKSIPLVAVSVNDPWSPERPRLTMRQDASKPHSDARSWVHPVHLLLKFIVHAHLSYSNYSTIPRLKTPPSAYFRLFHFFPLLIILQIFLLLLLFFVVSQPRRIRYHGLPFGVIAGFHPMIQYKTTTLALLYQSRP